MKKPIIIFFALFLVSCTLSQLYKIRFRNAIAHDMNPANVEFKSDVEPIKNNFPNMPPFQKCLWKTNTIGSTNFGPVNYWIKGFVILDESSKLRLLQNYTWEVADINFSEGFHPTDTGFQNFSWQYNHDFQKIIANPAYGGDVFFDSLNGIVYFDLQNN